MLEKFEIQLTKEEAEKLRNSTWEHKTLIVVDKVKNQILEILDKKENLEK